ncbi:MAG: hypothetical protein Ct9H300mP6_14660 [Gammaproteobacteria bacterium]|nr:MAG: hypothetical protein Ct9H300mP6_14660 [Gammaproteobacteria bacterium]
MYGMAKDIDRINVNTTFDPFNDMTLEAKLGF